MVVKLNFSLIAGNIHGWTVVYMAKACIGYFTTKVSPFPIDS